MLSHFDHFNDYFFICYIIVPATVTAAIEKKKKGASECR
jgi:hypothetical protein